MLGARRGVTEFIEGKRSDRLDIKCLVSCTQTWNCSSRLFQRNIIFKDNVTETLTLIYYFYKRSAKRNNEVQEVAEIMEEHFHKPEKASGTSWVDLKLRPATKLIANWKLIVIHLQNYIEDKSNKAEDWPKGKGILKKIMEYKFIWFLHFMTDVLNEIPKLSLLLQKEDVALPSTIVLKLFREMLIRLEHFV